MHYDFIIIGGGVIGSSIARELAKYCQKDRTPLRLAVLEKESDLVCETSGRNSGVLHAGFNNRPGSKMAQFCVSGNRRFDRLAAELDVPFQRTGKLVVGFDNADRKVLTDLIAAGQKNGCPDLRLVDRAEIHRLAPSIDGPFAMYSPHSGILNPFLYTIALAENAQANGVNYYLNHEVTAVARTPQAYRLTAATPAGPVGFDAAWVINAAGLGAERIARLFGITDYTIYPCRGEYYVLDKNIGGLLNMPVYPVPNVRTGGLGIHLTPTIDGNILIGPSAEYLDSSPDYATTQPVLDLLLADGGRIFPQLKRDQVIRSFAGLRPKLVPKEAGGYHDFVIELRPKAERMINLMGIESPGLTSAQPIAEAVVELVQSRCSLFRRDDFQPEHRFGPIFQTADPDTQSRLIAADPNYGEVICRCEQITKAEVLRAIHNPLGAHTLSAIKVRCRTMTGRCQGGYCQTRIAGLLQTELKLPLGAVDFTRSGAWMFSGKVRDEQ